MDQGIIKSFKAQYRAQYIERAINCYDANVTPSAIYDINQLEAMWLAHNAWHKVDADMIQHCWRKANILPDPPTIPPPSIPISMLINTTSNPLVLAENLVTVAMDGLASRGVFQASNRMTIEELLNPLDESTNMDGATDEEIYKAVIHSRAQCENAAANDIGDNDVNDDTPIDLPPSRYEALQAKITIEKYVATINEPYARKLESILADFARSTRLVEDQKMKVSLLTDYFACK